MDKDIIDDAQEFKHSKRIYFIMFRNVDIGYFIDVKPEITFSEQGHGPGTRISCRLTQWVMRSCLPHSDPKPDFLPAASWENKFKYMTN